MKKFLLILITFLCVSTSLFSQSQPYLILISFDAFRWDYGNRGISPNIEYMKENGVSALSLRSGFPSKTFPNHYAIISGMYPSDNGLIANSFYDPFTKEIYRLSDSTQIKNGKWYLGEAFWQTADRSGIKSASYFWPGSEMKPDYRSPDYYMHYDHSRPFDDRVQGVIDWLKLPYSKRPHFITLYFEATDDMGHKYGPDSKQVDWAIQKEDSALGLLFQKLKEINLFDSTNIILVSDHGMTNISKEKVINIQDFIKDYKIYYQENGPLLMLQPEKSQVEEVYELLKKHQDHFEVFAKQNIPACYHFSSNAFIPDIIVMADLGWSLVDDRSMKWVDKSNDKGNHGYDNFALDMQGIFYAMGPAFKKDYQTGTINNVDIYPLMCKIFNIAPRSNVDGKLENIEYILKGY
jgi:ectonucleotide pyrophosphatase/phosphodiesterase family protein 5